MLAWVLIWPGKIFGMTSIKFDVEFLCQKSIARFLQQYYEISHTYCMYLFMEIVDICQYLTKYSNLPIYLEGKQSIYVKKLPKECRDNSEKEGFFIFGTQIAYKYFNFFVKFEQG